jgi:hypothetical protein
VVPRVVSFVRVCDMSDTSHVLYFYITWCTRQMPLDMVDSVYSPNAVGYGGQLHTYVVFYPLWCLSFVCVTCVNTRHMCCIFASLALEFLLNEHVLHVTHASGYGGQLHSYLIWLLRSFVSVR